MSICDNPYSIPTIELTECVGISLATINSNFSNLTDEVCSTNTLLKGTSADYTVTDSRLVTLSALSPGIAKAWVVFNGTNPVSVYDTFNVASVTRTSTGTYTLSFVPAFKDTNYALVGTSFEKNNSNYTWLQPTTCTTSTAVINIHSHTNQPADPEYVSVLIYHN